MLGVPDGGWLAAGEPVTLDNCEREAIHLPGRVQAHGAVVIVELAGEPRILQASENVAEILGGRTATELVGQPLSALTGEAAVAELLTLPTSGPPAVRPYRIHLGDGRPQVVAQCFTPRPGALGVAFEKAPVVEPDASMTRYSSIVASRLGAAGDERSCVSAAIALMKDATGFDRVWAYRFESDGHGVVVAEERDDRLTPFVGLHFPESDIPAPARAMYVSAGVRLIGDSQRSGSPLVPEIDPVSGDRTDLSATDLRGVSPMHVRYLQNMGVRTSMSVPIVIDGRLWGLLSAHQYDEPREVSVLVRGQCETLGLLTSMQLAAIGRSQSSAQEAAAQRHLRQLAARLGGAPSATQALIGDERALLDLCGADAAIVSIGEQVRTVGNAPAMDDADRLLASLNERAEEDIVVLDDLAAFDASLADLAPQTAGVIAICLSRPHCHWVIWTRSEQLEHITWANRSRELVRREPDGTLELGARESFERWAETVGGRCAPWNDAQIDAAREVRAAIGAHAFQHALHAQERAADLARVNEELDAFAYSAAHDLRQPVRAIAMRTDFLIEDLMGRISDDETQSLHTISRLTGHMGSLVDSLLAYAKLDYAAHQPQRIHLNDILSDVRDLLGTVADDAVITSDHAVVRADPQVLRQVLFNLVWNAIKYNDQTPQVHVGTTKLSRLKASERKAVEISEAATDDPDVIYVRDNGIGIDTAHLETIFGLFRRLHSSDDYGGGSGAGLALSRRLIQRSGGTIWASSRPGHGSTFYFTTSSPTPSG